jgi:predicted transposase/invertase (TIGR01784 family)
MRYLDPKYDLTFKRVFGEHKHLCISLINSMIPFDDDRKVVSIEYETNELIPERKLARNSIVDVRCTDNYNRHFIVEMQMEWTESFMQRVLFNAAKVYVKDLNKAEEYELLNPVYSLNFLKQNFEKSPEMSDIYFHHYKIVNVADTGRQIRGMEFIFIELLKFKASNRAEKKLQDLWLRYFTEINENIEKAPAELLAQAETCEAIQYMEKGAFTDAEMMAYDREKDEILSARSRLSDAKKEGLKEGEEIGLAKGEEIGIIKGRVEGEEIGLAKGRAEGWAEGRAEGFAEGERKKEAEIVSKLANNGFSAKQIVEVTNLTIETINEILKQKK